MAIYMNSFLAACVCLWALLASCKAGCSIDSEMANTKGTQSQQYNLATGKTLDTCKEICLSEAQCVSGDFNSNNGVCVLYNAETTQQPENGKIFFIKTCVPDPPVPCTMTRTSNTKGGLTIVQMKLTSLDDCSSACLYISECQGVTYTSNTCRLYNGTPSASNSGAVLQKAKQPCPFTGKICCMENTNILKAESNEIYTITATLQSCEDICLKTISCMSVYFKDNVCYLYVSATTTSGDAGSTYSVKTCTETETVTDSITTECIGGSGVTSSQATYTILFAVLLSKTTL